MKTLKLFLILLFCTAVLNTYSINFSNNNLETTEDSTVTTSLVELYSIIRTDCDKIIDLTSKIGFNKLFNKISSECGKLYLKDFDRITDKTNNCSDKIFDKKLNFFDKKYSIIVLILLSLIMLFLSIFLPYLIISLGFMAPHALMWLLLLGSSCLLSFIGAGILLYINNQKFKNILVIVINVLTALAGIVSSVILGFLALLALLFIGEY